MLERIKAAPFGRALWVSADTEAQSPVFVKRFKALKSKKAVLNITSLGFFNIVLNGKRINDEYFVPAVTDFEARDTKSFLYPISDTLTHRLYYYSYDITDTLKEDNQLEIQLGNGWYRQTERIAEGKLSFGDTLKLIFNINADGNTFTSGEDMSWYNSDIVYSNLFIGEISDPASVTREEHPVTVCDAPETVISEAQGVPDRVIRTVTPTLLSEINGRKIFDVGENTSGFVKIVTNASKGHKITLRFSEVLDEYGELKFESTGAGYVCASGKNQIMTDIFICDGKQKEFEPLFVWHAFRYFDIEGDFESAEVKVIHSDIKQSSSFESSSEGLNFLYDAYIRSQLTNMHGSIPSDCPHRERLGYTGDGQACAETAMLTLNSKEFYRKWITDILDCQCKTSGHVQHTAPFMGGGGGPGGWGCAIVFVPYAFYKQFGETEMLERCYSPMKHWVDYLSTRLESGLIVREEDGGWCLGEWCTLDECSLPEEYVNSCYFIKIIDIICQIADIIGKSEDTEELIKLKAEIITAVNDKFFNTSTQSYCEGIQGADAFAVWCGILGKGEISKIAERYNALGHFDTGFLCTEILLGLLFENGYEDTAFKLLESEDIGSYLYMKRRGATTLWENWNGADSLNHPMFGAGAKYLFSSLAGISQPENSAGYRSLVIAPKIPKTLDYINAKVLLPIGEVTVRIKRKADALFFDIILPDNVCAEFKYKEKTAKISGHAQFTV